MVWLSGFGEARLGEARRGMAVWARRGKARRGVARRGWAMRGEAGCQGLAWLGQAGRGEVRLSCGG